MVRSFFGRSSERRGRLPQIPPHLGRRSRPQLLDQFSRHDADYRQDQIKNIRRKMLEIITKEVGSADLKETVNKLIPDSIGKDIEKACHSIYPLYDVFINKVKVLKRPRFDLGKLLEMHGEGKGAVAMETGEGEVVTRPEGYEPPVLDSV